jgi:3',5'-nucleoside bisphosphate phosphatase
VVRAAGVDTAAAVRVRAFGWSVPPRPHARRRPRPGVRVVTELASLARLPDSQPTFDLQSHSRHSDGSLPAPEVVAAAAAAGVQLLALSDHDTVAGVAEAAAEAQQRGISLVSATEISALDQAGADLHILGYGIDIDDSELGARLGAYRADREGRADRMADALRELGFELDDSVLQRRVAQGKPIGRPHLAQAVVEHSANAGRLAEEGRSELSVFLEAYLIEGRPAFRSRTIPTVSEAIQTIHDAGGVAVWAHPFWDVKESAEVLATIDRFHELGIDGVECFYATHTREQAELLADRCVELNLLSTGSSDFHGPEHKLFSRFLAFSTYGRDPVLGPIAR